MSSREGAMPEQPSFCAYRPLPGEILKTACPDCGHAAVLHIGVEHCPVCELVHLNQWARADTPVSADDETFSAAVQTVVTRGIMAANRRYLIR